MLYYVLCHWLSWLVLQAPILRESAGLLQGSRNLVVIASTAYLREDVIQIVYAPLEASAVVIREVRGCTPVGARLTVRIVTTRYLQRFNTALQGLNLHHYACTVVKTRVLQLVWAGLLN